jgi:hypothetical protein
MEIKNIEMRQHELRWALRRKQVKDEITQRKQQQWQLAQESKESYKKAYDDACKAIEKDMQAVMAELDNEQAERLMAIAKEEDDYKFEVSKYTQQLKEGGVA